MALINCPECNRTVSDTAKLCPQCGFDIRNHRIKETKEKVEFCKSVYTSRKNQMIQEKENNNIVRRPYPQKDASILKDKLLAILFGVLFLMYLYLTFFSEESSPILLIPLCLLLALTLLFGSSVVSSNNSYKKALELYSKDPYIKGALNSSEMAKIEEEVKEERLAWDNAVKELKELLDQEKQDTDKQQFSDNSVQIKLGTFRSIQKASITSNGRVLWSGNTGQIIELPITSPTKIKVNYEMGLLDGAGSCQAIIDPKKSQKWQVVSLPGIATMKLDIQPVDYFVAN